MRKSLKLVGGIAGAALLLSAAGPASARGWGWGPSYRHYDRGSDAGAVIGAIAVVGIIAAIASTASANNRAATTDRRYDGPPPSSSPSYDDRPYSEQGPGDSRYDNRSAPPADTNSLAMHASQDEAVDACVIAARDEGTSRAGYADVREIGSVRPRDNGWDVSGTINERQNYRATGHLRNFTCAFEDGRVSNVSMD